MRGACPSQHVSRALLPEVFPASSPLSIPSQTTWGQKPQAPPSVCFSLSHNNINPQPCVPRPLLNACECWLLSLQPHFTNEESKAP